MRTVLEIDADIMRMENEVRELYGERDRAVLARHAEIIRLFDEGGKFAAISREVGVPFYTVKNILWQAGKTVRGREAIRAHRASLRPRATATP